MDAWHSLFFELCFGKPVPYPAFGQDGGAVFGHKPGAQQVLVARVSMKSRCQEKPLGLKEGREGPKVGKSALVRVGDKKLDRARR